MDSPLRAVLEPRDEELERELAEVEPTLVSRLMAAGRSYLPDAQQAGQFLYDMTPPGMADAYRQDRAAGAYGPALLAALPGGAVAKGAMKTAAKGPVSQYVRRSLSVDTPFNEGVGYAMFKRADDDVNFALEDLESYGPGKWVSTDEGAVPVAEIQKDLVRAFRRNNAHEDHQTTAAQLARQADPSDIRNSAEMWDNPDLVQIAWDQVLEPRGITAVRTHDGLIKFDIEGIIRKYGIAAAATTLGMSQADLTQAAEAQGVDLGLDDGFDLDAELARIMAE